MVTISRLQKDARAITRDDAIGHILAAYQEGGGAAAAPSESPVPPPTDRDIKNGHTRGEVVYWRPDHWQTISNQAKKRRETPSQLVATLVGKRPPNSETDADVPIVWKDPAPKSRTEDSED